jgi:metal-responsive CopG/Arc/MetJ family transcriptional regulator
MTRIDVNLPDELVKELRQEVIIQYEGKKGDLTKAIKEAIRLWLAEKKRGRA